MRCARRRRYSTKSPARSAYRAPVPCHRTGCASWGSKVRMSKRAVSSRVLTTGIVWSPSPRCRVRCDWSRLVAPKQKEARIMYARIATFENPNLSLVDDLIGKVRSSAASGVDLRDAKGFLMLLDRQSAKSLGITFFDSEEAIRAAEPVFERMGDEIPAEQRGQRVSIEVYEVAAEELSEGAKAARVSVLEGSPERIEEGTRYAQENVLPKARELQGWKGYISLVDRDNGLFKLITLW